MIIKLSCDKKLKSEKVNSIFVIPYFLSIIINTTLNKWGLCSISPTLLEHKRSKWHIVELSFSKKSFTLYFTHNTKTTLNQLHLQLLPCKYSLISLSTFSLCLSALNSWYPRTHFKSHGQSHLLYGWKISQGLCWIQHFIADIN